MYVLDCIHDGLSEEQIVKNCDGDAQIVKIWLDFLKDNRWVVRDGTNNKWMLTDRGMQQMESYYQV